MNTLKFGRPNGEDYEQMSQGCAWHWVAEKRFAEVQIGSLDQGRGERLAVS